MAKQGALGDEARKVEAHVDELLTDRNGGKRYPGTELVLHKGQRVAGTTTRSQAVRRLRARGYMVVKRGEDDFVVT